MLARATSLVAAFVVVAFGLILIAFTGVVFAKPAVAERFLMRFASSARTHYVEQVFRLLIGVALVVLSPAMWQHNNSASSAGPSSLAPQH